MTLKKPKTHRVLSVCIVISGHDHEMTWLFPMRCPVVRRVRPWAVRSPSDGSSENRPMSGVFVRSAVRKAVRNVRWPSENRPKGRSMAVRVGVRWDFWPRPMAVRKRLGARPKPPPMAFRRRVRWPSDGASDGPSDGAFAVVRWLVRSSEGRWGPVPEAVSDDRLSHSMSPLGGLRPKSRRMCLSKGRPMDFR